MPGDGEIVLNEGRRTVDVQVANRGDRPIQVAVIITSSKRTARSRSIGARPTACGSISRRHAVRFEPGETKTVTLVAIAGARVIRVAMRGRVVP